MSDNSGALNAGKREKCWLARDKYFECLDKEGSDTPCQSLYQILTETCPQSWVIHNMVWSSLLTFTKVKHFLKKRNDDKKLEEELRKHNATLIKLG